MKNNLSRSKEQGFSVIEALVTVLIASIFLITIYSLYQSIVTISVRGSQQSAASNLVYSALRRYANGTTPTWYSCDSSNPNASKTLYNGSTDTGQSGVSNLESDFNPDTFKELPKPVRVTVEASAPYGCTNRSKPLLVRANVDYGNPVKKVDGILYVSF
jgi:type II secretory pathway pseudopilin PulG